MVTASPQSHVGPHYKWIALSNTTLGVLMATINASILLIALPDIFRGIGVNPLQPGNTTLLLWLIMGYLVVTAVLVVSFGRLGDMFGRVRMFNLGFAIFALFSVAALGHLAARHARRLVADRDADPAGRRRGDADGQLQRDPHRRVPRQRARPGARAEPGGGHRRRVHRPRARRPARPDQLAATSSSSRSRSACIGAIWSYLKLQRAGHPAAGEARLVGQPHLRRRPDRDPGRHHLRHPALRRSRDGLDQPAGPRR